MSKGTKVFVAIISIIGAAVLTGVLLDVFSTKMQKYYLVDNGR